MATICSADEKEKKILLYDGSRKAHAYVGNDNTQLIFNHLYFVEQSMRGGYLSRQLVEQLVEQLVLTTS